MPLPAVCTYKHGCTNANTHAPVGADDPVRPAVCTCEHKRTDANPYNVCRGRCPHRPARDAPAKSHDFGDLQMLSNSRRGGALPLPAVQRCKLVCTNAERDVLRGRCLLCDFAGAPCAGGAEPRPYGVSGNAAFLRYLVANLPLRIGRTEASAPTKHCAGSPLCILVCDCVPRGRGRAPPLRHDRQNGEKSKFLKNSENG